MARKIIIEAEIGGIRQKFTIGFIEQKIPFGTFEVLDATVIDLPQKELIRIAKETGHPILGKDKQRYFPPNKTARDFIKK